MHPELAYHLGRDRIRERLIQAERDRLGAVVSDVKSAGRRDRGRIGCLRALSRHRMSWRATAGTADQR
jgi:hypothetical protein